MISSSNSKLGRVPNWSLPPMETCPGSTSLCRAACYVGGKKGYYKQYPSVRKAYSRNLADVTASDWSVDVMRYLSKHRPAKFRIHVSGDFHRAGYIRTWARIAAMFPGTKFLAFTRSWRVARLRKALEQLRQLPNIQLFASLDAEAFQAPEGWRKAWMGQPVENSGKTIMCPGYGPSELLCDACGLCFRPAAVNVYFPIH